MSFFVSRLVTFTRAALASAVCAGFLAACASAEAAPLAAHHPASASAEEVPLATPVGGADGVPRGGDPARAAEAPLEGHHPHDHAEKVEQGAVYTCPMHPEVRSAAPGSCPKCGMNLRPKAP